MELRQNSQNGLFLSLNGINGVFKVPQLKATLLIYSNRPYYKDDGPAAFPFVRKVLFRSDRKKRSSCESSTPWINPCQTDADFLTAKPEENFSR